MMLLQTILLAASCAQGYDHGDATSDEQLVLEIINRARLDPTAEGGRLGIAITESLTTGQQSNIGPRPPLAINKFLLTAARAHSRDMYFRNFFDHTNPDGLDPGERVTAAGYVWGNLAENLAAGPSQVTDSAAFLEDFLMVDTPNPLRDHRTNLLDVYDPDFVTVPPYRREIGIGWYSNAAANGLGWKALLTQDFGRQISSSVGPFLVGVVYTDLVVANNFYDIGEGVPQVTITVGGGGTTTSAPGGGFALPISSAASGSITVTASGGPLNTTLTQVLALTGENIRVEFKPTLAQILDTDGDGIPDFYESRHGLNPLVDEGPLADLDGDGFTNQVEYQRGTNPHLALSTPESAGGSGLPSVILVSGGSGACGSTGLDLLLLPGLLGLVRLRRRIFIG